MNRIHVRIVIVLSLLIVLAAEQTWAQVNPFTGEKVGAKPAPPAAQGSSPADLNTKAQALIAGKKYDEAILLLKQAIAQDAKNIQSYALLGVAYQQAKHLDLAVEAFLNLVKLNPNNGAFQNSLGGALLDYGKPAEARAAFERAVELNPTDAGSRFGIGSCYLKEKDYPESYQAFVKALGYAPDSPDVHNALGDALEQLNLHAESLAEYEAASRLSPGAVAPLFGRATALGGLKRFSEAEALMRDLVAKAPKEAASHTGLAQTLDASGKHDAAIAEYKIALTITPDDPYLWGNLGWADYNAGKYDEAVAASRKALSFDKTLAYVRFNIGLAYAVRDRGVESLKEYNDAISIAAAADIHAAINDLKDAQKKHNTSVVQQLITVLSAAEWKAMGLSPNLILNTKSK